MTAGSDFQTCQKKIEKHKEEKEEAEKKRRSKKSNIERVLEAQFLCSTRGHKGILECICDTGFFTFLTSSLCLAGHVLRRLICFDFSRSN